VNSIKIRGALFDCQSADETESAAITHLSLFLERSTSGFSEIGVTCAIGDLGMVDWPAFKEEACLFL
jgi:hypothetical protein